MLEPQNHFPRTQKGPDWEHKKKCYPIPEIPTTTISIEPTKLRKNQANGTPNDNPTRDMQNHDHIN